MFKFLLVLLLLLPTLSFASNEGDFDKILAKEVEYIDALISELGELNVSDGVSLDEANVIIGAIYYSKYGDGCGAPGEIADDGEFWKIPTFSGFAASPDAPLYIDKKTGEVRRRNSTLVSDPTAIDLVLPNFYKKHKSKI